MFRLGQLAGTHANGTIRLEESGLNDALRAAQAGTQPAMVEVHERNRLVVRYGMLHAQVILPSALDPGPSPRLTVTLASVLIAIALKATLRQPYVHVHGKHITIDLAEVPALVDWRDAWPHLTRLEFATQPRWLGVSFTIDIAEQSHA